MTRLMQGFPPAPKEQVTLANWRTAPFNGWAFHHVREIVPSADIPNDPAAVLDLPSSPVDLSTLALEEGGERPRTFGDFLDEASTDGAVVLRHGRVVFERYADGMTAGTPHILMSVSKSLLGLLAGVVASRGDLRPDRPVMDVIPEIAGTAYEGATIRHLLDMRAGILWDEDYSAASGPIVQYRKATGWNPLAPGEAVSDLRGFYRTLTDRARPHGGPVHYTSPNTDLLGWVIERSTGQRYADLMSELIWKPMGATCSAYITVDRLGAPRCAGGVCATAQDLARVGHVIVNGGSRGSVQIVPEAWIEDIVAGGDPEVWAAGDLADYFPRVPMRYRSQWYVRDGHAPLVFGFGIHGQYLFVDRAHAIVVALVSSQAIPVDAARIGLTIRAVSRVTQALAGQ